ncbi:MAG: hypothetical protein WA871_07860 [Candidatus Acidiferrales bacterium]
MTPQSNPTGSSIRLPATLAIGFTGHRKLPDEAKSRKLVYDFLSQRKTAAPGLIYGVSSVAAGADLLFCESCIQLEIPLHVLLPMPAEEFRNDFDADTWARAEHVMQIAVSVEVTGGHQPRQERYYECGIQTVQQCQLLVTVWNGEPSHGMGGTEDIVSFARGLGMPVVWFHSATGEMQVFNEKSEEQMLHDPELDFLNGLPDPPKTEPETPGSQALVWAWFRKMDDCANQTAPRLRRLAAIPIVCTAAAALFTGAASWAHAVATWLAVGSALGITAAALPLVLGLHGRQIVWARTRTAAEVCRSVLALWRTPSPYAVIGPEVVPDLSGMLITLNLLKMRDHPQGGPSLDDFKRGYRAERVADQITYFSRHAVQSATTARKYQTVIGISIALAILANVWMYVGSHVFHHMNSVDWKHSLAAGASLAFQIATVAGALLVVNDVERRRQRYREMQYLLTEWDSQLERLRTWTSVLRIVNRIERALLIEVIEWRSVIRHRKLPSK